MGGKGCAGRLGGARACPRGDTVSAEAVLVLATERKNRNAARFQLPFPFPIRNCISG
jgi:hypothetical protein